MAPLALSSVRAPQAARGRMLPAKATPGSKHNGVAVATASAAAAILLSSAPAFAGVALEQPKLKKAFVTDDAAIAAEKEAAAAAAAAKPKPAAKAEPVEEEVADGMNVQSLWPLGIVACGGALFGLSKIDPGFQDLFDNAVKDSSTVGIGTEDSLKASGGYMAPYYEDDSVGSGTKALKKKSLFGR